MNYRKIKYIFTFIFIFIFQYSYAYNLAEGCNESGPITSTEVFNWRYYLNNNPDLLMANLKTPKDACSHWLNFGSKEGRQAHSGFHSKQYLQKYNDISSHYGRDNYIMAISHYVSNGINEGRSGYLENGISSGYQTSTISNNYDGSKILLGVNRINSGAIDSLIFNNIEYINSFDRGRELQIAAVSSYGEGYNPTEAGSCNNGYDGSTSSFLNEIIASGNTLFTSNTPSFWRWPGNSNECGFGFNSTKTAENFRFYKNIEIGSLPGIPSTIIFRTQINVFENVPQDPYSPYGAIMRVEVPTGYLSGDFNRIFRYNFASDSIYEIEHEECLRNNGCVSNDPLVFSKRDLSHSISSCTGGASGANFSNSEKYQAFGELDPRSPINSTTKFAILKYIQGEIKSGTKLNFNSYISVAKSNSSLNSVE